jgi:hypothetical protein
MGAASRHPAYQLIIVEGPAVVPLLLRDLRADLPQIDRLRGATATPGAEAICPRVRVQRFSP